MPKCRICKCEFTPARPLQPVCADYSCRLTYALAHAKKTAQKRDKAERQEIRKRKQALKRRGDYVKEAQTAVNKFRRTEELSKGEGCISCGRTQQEVQATDGWKPGGAWDAGHFLSVGSHPNLRFEPMNIWLQCKSCNAGSGKYAHKRQTVSQQYRANLVKKIGLEAVESLEADNTPRKWTIPELIEIRDTYKRKLKELNAQRPDI